MQAGRSRRSAIVGLIEGTVLAACLVAAVLVGASTDRARHSDAGMQAWGERLQAQAETYRYERARDAWAARLEGVARESQARDRANDAWAARLEGVARESQARDRANDAWAARLTGLAEEYMAGR